MARSTGGVLQPPVTTPPRKPRRSEALRVLKVTSFRARKGLPEGGRDACRDGPRPCPFVRCKFHLWMVLGYDRQGHRLMREATSTVEPHSATTCSLDVSEQERTAREIGEVMGITQRRVQQIVKAALEKLRAKGVEVRTIMEG